MVKKTARCFLARKKAIFKHIMLKAHCHETWKAQTWALFVPFYHSTVTSAVKTRYAEKNAVQPRAQ